MRGQPSLHRDAVSETTKQAAHMWEAGRKRHQTFRNEAAERLFNWKIRTTFNTSSNPVPLPRLPFAPAQGGERPLDVWEV